MRNPRRQVLKAAVAGAALLATAGAMPTLAKAPMSGGQMVSVHRMKLGSFEVTTILDGFLEIDPKLLNAEVGIVQSLMKAAGLPYSPIRTPVNAFLVNTGEKLVLLDTGGAKFLGPNAGRLAQGLAAAGVSPTQVDEIYITHSHGDHLHGAVTPEGAALFPNAVLRIAQLDVDYWLNPAVEAAAPEAQKGRFMAAKRARAAYGDRFKPFVQGQELTPGITAVAAVGHTPGHTCFMVSSGGERLLAIGDMIHVGQVQFSNPEITVAFDWEQSQAAKMRMSTFEMAASEDLLIAAVHLPFPGIGKLRKEAKAFHYTPISWRLF
jgi:glyoxylase-like metal-dependent hydrolase (beta-lactamase superfamily II)